MSDKEHRYESMVFNYETTMRHDYRDGEVRDIVRTVYKEKPKRLSIRTAPLKNSQTLTDWKSPCVPIDLLVKPKEVVRTNPKNIQQRYVPLEDSEKAQVQATRPRLVMTPAVSMDDILDERRRDILVKEMYTSSAKSAMEMGIPLDYERSNVIAPLLGTLSPASPITIKKLQFPYVSPEWRMDGVSWDWRQLRSHSDSCKEFYLARPLRCKFCDETAAREMSRKAKQIKRNDI